MSIEWKPEKVTAADLEATLAYDFGVKGEVVAVTVHIGKKYGMTLFAADTSPRSLTIHHSGPGELADAQIEAEARILAGVCADAATAWQEAHR
jgi:hypothetical protein